MAKHADCRERMKEASASLPAGVKASDFQVCKTPFGKYEVVGPSRLSWHGHACCAFDARAKAYTAASTRRGR